MRKLALYSALALVVGFAGNVYAQSALDVFCYRVAKYIGAYVAAMNGKLGQMKDYSAQLDRIIAILDGLDLTSAENQKILKAIKEAIENHKCDCNCGNNGNHEGILGDVENALNGLV